MVTFHGFDIEDASIRSLAVGLSYYNGGGRNFTKGPILQSLNDLQWQTIAHVVDTLMVRSPLLTKMIHTFIDTSRLNDNVMLAAGRRLQQYAVIDSGEPRSEEYRDLERAWENREKLPEPRGPANVGQHTAKMKRLHLERLTAQGAEELRLDRNRARGLGLMDGIEEDQEYRNKLGELRDAGYGPYVKGGVESDDDTSEEGDTSALKPKKKVRTTVNFKHPSPELDEQESDVDTSDEGGPSDPNSRKKKPGKRVRFKDPSPKVRGRSERDAESAAALQLERARYLANIESQAGPNRSSNVAPVSTFRGAGTRGNFPVEIPDSEDEDEELI